MKTFKKIIITVLIVIILFASNLCYYLFAGQYKSTEKLNREEELNIYECCSIYSIHTAIWMFGWIISPESAEQAFLMTLPSKERTREYNGIFESDVIAKNSSYHKITLYFNINNVSSKELRYALALNGGIFYNTPYNREVVVDCSYGSRTDVFDLGIFKIELNYRLLSYIQNKSWIHRFQMTYTDPTFIPA